MHENHLESAHNFTWKLLEICWAGYVDTLEWKQGESVWFCVVSASWNATTTMSAVTVAADCNSGKSLSVTVSSQGTAAPLPSIGITPSSPDVSKTLAAGPSVHLLQSPVVQDQRAETAVSKNDIQVGLPADY